MVLGYVEEGGLFGPGLVESSSHGKHACVTEYKRQQSIE